MALTKLAAGLSIPFLDTCILITYIWHNTDFQTNTPEKGKQF